MSNKQYAITILTSIAIIIYCPLISLWTLNTIFNLNIAYNIWTWLAMSWFHIIIIFIRSTSNNTTINTITSPEILSSLKDGKK